MKSNFVAPSRIFEQRFECHFESNLRACLRKRRPRRHLKRSGSTRASPSSHVERSGGNKNFTRSSGTKANSSVHFERSGSTSASPNGPISSVLAALGQTKAASHFERSNGAWAGLSEAERARGRKQWQVWCFRGRAEMPGRPPRDPRPRTVF